MMVRGGYVYIITNASKTVLYTGVTNNIMRRIYEHKSGANLNSFSKRYNVNILVYYKEFQFIQDAIVEEKRIKAGSRKAKELLINTANLSWIDLSEGWYE